MTVPARRLGGGPASRARLSSRARAVLAAQLAAAPAKQPRGHLAQSLITTFLVGMLVVGALGSAVGLVGAGLVNSLAAGLPDPTNLAGLKFDQPTVIYDRTGKVELARFELQNRRVVAFADIPKLVLDATTTAEDRTFWDNGGFDAGAITALAFQNLAGSASSARRLPTTTQLRA